MVQHFYYSCHYRFIVRKSIPSYIVSKHYKQLFCFEKKREKIDQKDVLFLLHILSTGSTCVCCKVLQSRGQKDALRLAESSIFSPE